VSPSDEKSKVLRSRFGAAEEAAGATVALDWGGADEMDGKSRPKEPRPAEREEEAGGADDPDAERTDPLRRLSSASSDRSGKVALLLIEVSGGLDVNAGFADVSRPPNGGTLREERRALRSSAAVSATGTG
jgi:hypothetical protein